MYYSTDTKILKIQWQCFYHCDSCQYWYVNYHFWPDSENRAKEKIPKAFATRIILPKVFLQVLQFTALSNNFQL